MYTEVIESLAQLLTTASNKLCTPESVHWVLVSSRVPGTCNQSQEWIPNTSTHCILISDNTSLTQKRDRARSASTVGMGSPWPAGPLAVGGPHRAISLNTSLPLHTVVEETPFCSPQGTDLTVGWPRGFVPCDPFLHKMITPAQAAWAPLSVRKCSRPKAHSRAADRESKDCTHDTAFFNAHVYF